MRQIIRLTESDIHRIIKESVYRVLRESNKSFYLGDNPNLMDRDTYFHSANADKGFGMKRDNSKEFRHNDILNDLYNGEDYYQDENDGLRYEPFNDANLNIYDYQGQPSIFAQSSDSEESKIGRGFRDTLRGTYRETFGKEIPRD